ncbi:CLUMA_CG004397, isoform A [Clunio marinus]|uniref:CLUMA_CG004397, isoform A n=1 Tax=Clunio marinus TaxID=568069 RepID=A0A1J1HRK2_9DIPT|nr:CLUMA_CG004397, isoform A [Clunio marinus]
MKQSNYVYADTCFTTLNGRLWEFEYNNVLKNCRENYEEKKRQRYMFRKVCVLIINNPKVYGVEEKKFKSP